MSEYNGLFCPKCGEKLEDIAVHIQEEYREETPRFYGFDVYCDNCEFSGYINPDDTNLEETKQIYKGTENKDRLTFFPHIISKNRKELAKEVKETKIKDKDDLASLDEL